jgi:FHS family glucose/mannose:H+ symporter-like MFS transporter
MGIRHQLLSGISIAFAQSFFWGALLLGRLAASFLWRQTAPRMLISVSLATATAGIVLLATTTSRGVLFCGMLLAGAGLAAVFPTTVAVFSPQTRTTKKAFSGVVFAAAGLGGAAVPAFIGIISGHGYSLRLALWLLAAITAIMLLIEQKISRDVARQGVS